MRKIPKSQWSWGQTRGDARGVSSYGPGRRSGRTSCGVGCSPRLIRRRHRHPRRSVSRSIYTGSVDSSVPWRTTLGPFPRFFLGQSDCILKKECLFYFDFYKKTGNVKGDPLYIKHLLRHNQEFTYGI